MDVEKLPKLQLPDFGETIDPDRPVLSYDWQAEGAHRAAEHAHPRAHIIQPLSGAYWVLTGEGTWLVPQGLAIWIPPDIHHQVYSHGSTSARILFVDPAFAGPLPPRPGTVRMTPVLDALLARALEYGNEYGPNSPAARLARVMLDELERMEFSTLFLPVASNPRLARVMARVIDKDTEQRPPLGIDEIAAEAGASPRTLARLFRAETGMSYGQWRRNLLFARALERLEKGASVTEVAFDLGFSSASAFVYSFRRKLGVPPGQYAAGARRA